MGCCPEHGSTLGEEVNVRRPKGPTKRVARGIAITLGGVRWVLWYDPWRGVSPPVPTPLCAYCGCSACDSAAEEVERMKRPVLKVQAYSQEYTKMEPPALLKKLPHVAEMVANPLWEDGETKGSVAVMHFVTGGMHKIILKVERPALKLPVSGRSYDEVWAALEALLRGDDVPWEQDGSLGGSPSKKRRRGP